MGGVGNETDEHVNTNMITDRIRTALIQSARFRFVAGDLHGLPRAQLRKNLAFEPCEFQTDLANGVFDVRRGIRIRRQLLQLQFHFGERVFKGKRSQIGHASGSSQGNGSSQRGAG